jgi:hypothetical protein
VKLVINTGRPVAAAQGNSELRTDRAFLKRAPLFFAQEASDTNEKRSH